MLRLPVSLLTAAVLAALLAHAAPAPAVAAPVARAAEVDYGPLARVGVTARGATLQERTVTVRLRLKRRTEIRLAVVRGERMLGHAKRTLRRGNRTFTARLRGGPRPSGTRLQLRVTARAGKQRGRERLRLKILPPANRAPTDIALAPATVDENRPAGTPVGALTATDPDGADVHSFTLVPGPGDTGNALFAVSGATLVTAAVLDFEASAAHSVRVRVSDRRGATFEKALTVAVADANDPPTAIALSRQEVAENEPAGTAVGLLSATDQDRFDTHAYALVPGAGAADNGDFRIDGAFLRTRVPLDFEDRPRRSVRIRVADGRGGTLERAFTLAVLDVNDPPAGLTLSNASVPENEPPGTHVGTLAATDQDGDTLSFALVPGAGDDDNAAFAIAGADLRTAATFDFETRSAYSIRVRVSDGRGGTLERAFAITVTDAGEVPVVRTTPGVLAHTEGDPAAPVDPGITVFHPDGTQLQGAAVRISAGHQPGDELLFTSQEGITGSFDAVTGTLTLTGAATVAQYQDALRSVRYRHTGDDPVTAKTATFTVHDGNAESAPAHRAVAVTPVNDPPSVRTTATPLAYPEASGPLAIDPGLELTDPDSATLDGATVAITSNFAAGEDALAFTDQLGISGSYDAATGSLTLTGSASIADYQAALRTVTYENRSLSPSTAARTVTFTVTDGDGATGTATRAIEPGAVNDPAVVTTTADPLHYTERAPAVAVDPGLTIADPDDTHLTGATVRLVAGLEPDDELAFADQGGIAGSYSAATGTLTLTGTATVSAYQAALRAVTYRHTGHDPAVAKTVAFAADDGEGPGPAATRDIVVTPVADPPVLTTTASVLAYTEKEGPRAIDPALALADPDSVRLASATVAITVGFTAAQDTLAVAPRSGITSSYDAATGVLTLSGTATVAAYQVALRAVTYANSSSAPAPLARTVAFTATDEDGETSAAATRAIAITPVNDPPTAHDDDATTDENTVLTVAAPGVLANDTDPDTGDTKTVVELNGSATLTGASAKGAAVTIATDGSYTYDPGSLFKGLATGETETDSFAYTMRDAAGERSTATVRVTITGVSDPPVAVADTFHAVGNTVLYVGLANPTGDAGLELAGSLLDNDTDPDTPTKDLVAEPVTDAPTARGGRITIAADGTFSYRPKAGETGADDTFTYRVCDASPCTDATVANSTGTVTLKIATRVWYVRNDAPAGGDGTPAQPFRTLAAAQVASGSGDVVYVLAGDGTTAGLDTGFAMRTGQRLVGEHSGLRVDPDGAGPLPTHTLHPATPGARPALTAGTGQNAVTLAPGTTVDGVAIDPPSGGGGIAGNGANSVTIANVDIVDPQRDGGKPGLELQNSFGTQNIAGLVVDNGGASTATGVRLNNAGEIHLVAGGTVSITTIGAKALDVAGTRFAAGSEIDDVLVAGSSTGAVDVSAGGSLAIRSLDLATTGGSQPALAASNLTSLTVGAAQVSANGGPAVDVRSMGSGSLDFDWVASTGSAGRGVYLQNIGTGTFGAAGGAITGAAGTAFEVDGGSGAVTYAGTIADGAGDSAWIRNRTGGTVTLSGTITDSADAGGGIGVANNSGGSSVFSGASKRLETGAAAGVSLTGNVGHSVTFSGGDLDVDTTSGPGVTATGGGTLTIAGTGNTIDTATGTALRVTSTTIGSGGITFRRISAGTAAAGPATGIVLETTGSAGGLTVTGAGGACTPATPTCSGGEIRRTTGDAVSLTATKAPSLALMHLHDNAGNGIRASAVESLSLTDSVVAANGDDAVGGSEANLRLYDLSGTSTITRSVVRGAPVHNVYWTPGAGSMTLDVTDTAVGPNDPASGGAGLLLDASGTARPRLSVAGGSFTGHRGDSLRVAASGTAAVDATVAGGTQFTDSGAGASLSAAQGSKLTFDIADAAFLRHVNDAVQVVVNDDATAASSVRGRVADSTIGDAAPNSGSRDGRGISYDLEGAGSIVLSLLRNSIRHTDMQGVFIQARRPTAPAAAGPNVDLTVRDNGVSSIDDDSTDPWGTQHGIQIEARHNSSVCLDIAGNASTAIGGAAHFLLRQRDTSAFRLERLTGSGADDANVTTFVAGQNAGGSTASVTRATAFTAVADGACQNP